jgi:hypothetical protein
VLYSTLSKDERINVSVQARISSFLPLDIERYLIPEPLLSNALSVYLRLQSHRKDIQNYKQFLDFNFEEAITRAVSFSASDDDYLVKNYTAFYEDKVKNIPIPLQAFAKVDAMGINGLKKATILSMVREFLIYFCIDTLTLSERIAGRSPAFEGIRLVKERRKP